MPGEPIDTDQLDAVVREAIEALGYVHLEFADDLVASFRRLRPGGWSAAMLVSRDERALWTPMLTEKGLRDPRHAAEATTRRVIFNLQRSKFDREEVIWQAYSNLVQFVARAQPQYHCAQALSMNGSVVARQKRWPVPLPGCAKEWCPCRWDQLPDD